MRGYKYRSPIKSETPLWLAVRRETSEDKWPFPMHTAANQNRGKQHVPISHEWRLCDPRKVWVNTDIRPWVECWCWEEGLRVGSMSNGIILYESIGICWYLYLIPDVWTITRDTARMAFIVQYSAQSWIWTHRPVFASPQKPWFH